MHSVIVRHLGRKYLTFIQKTANLRVSLSFSESFDWLNKKTQFIRVNLFQTRQQNCSYHECTVNFELTWKNDSQSWEGDIASSVTSLNHWISFRYSALTASELVNHWLDSIKNPVHRESFVCWKTTPVLFGTLEHARCTNIWRNRNIMDSN